MKPPLGFRNLLKRKGYSDETVMHAYVGIIVLLGGVAALIVGKIVKAPVLGENEGIESHSQFRF